METLASQKFKNGTDKIVVVVKVVVRLGVAEPFISWTD